jgi:type IX secretion system PorP/SprF family membrane protein
MKNLFSLYIIMLLPSLMFAQQDPLVSQYMFNGLYLNPAYAGSHDFYNVTSLCRKQWVNIDGAPATQILSVDGPLKNRNVGLGLLLSNDKIGVSKQTDFYGNYAYHINLGKETKLAMGLRAGGSYYRAKLTELTVWDGGDDVFSKDIKGEFLPNFGAGLYLHSPKMFVGLSAPHLLNYKPRTTFYIDKTNSPQLIRHYYLNAGYVFDGNQNVIFKPSILVKYLQNAPVQADFNLNVLFHKLIWLGASYRTSDSFVGILELQASKKIRIGYAYDHPINNLKKYTNGSHEIMFAYDFGYDIHKIKTPRYF